MTRFQRITAEILEQISQQARQVETMVQLGIEALEQKSALSGKVKRLERQVNRREVEIEEQCLGALAMFQPFGSELRTLATVLKANGDLERIADLALNLTERAEALSEYDDIDVPRELEEMVRYSLQMVKDADRALSTRDVALARNVCVRDDQLDAMNRELISFIADRMEQNPKLVKAELHLFSASRIIERIGDHATNIAEDVLYMVEGEITRHQFKLPRDRMTFPQNEQA